MALIRYPGAKAKLLDGILGQMPDEYVVPLIAAPDVHYVEPFFGSGAIGLEVMRRMHHEARITIADADIGIASLWRSVRNHPQELLAKVMEYTPTTDSFYRLKEMDGQFTDEVDTGFRKLALHRISVSGFGAMAGGPIGGRDQQGDYKVGCRWRPHKIRLQVQELHKRMKAFANMEILCADVFDVLHDANETTSRHSLTFVYLDPPYYEKGDQLYAIKFSPLQHERLAGVLLNADFAWAASYDDHDEIRRLYAGCDVRRLEITYCNAVCRDPMRRKNHEVLILPAPKTAGICHAAG